jgi:acetylglutamate kinase
MKKNRIVIKIGGKAAAAESSLNSLVREMGEMRKDYDLVLVHGGGAEVSRVTKVFGIEPVFKDGIRMTGNAEMDIVDMVLAGKMNKSLVRLFQSRGIRAVGLSGSDGGLFTGKSIESSADTAPSRRGNRTGHITDVEPKVLEILLEAGFLPVVASTSMDEWGGGLNINADEAALEIAKALKAAGLVFLSDIPGILKEGRVITGIDEAKSLREIEAGVISGGMIPKVQSSVEALRAGVYSIVIGEFTEYGDLRLLTGREKGTTIYRGNTEQEQKNDRNR